MQKEVENSVAFSFETRDAAAVEPSQLRLSLPQAGAVEPSQLNEEDEEKEDDNVGVRFAQLDS